MNEAMIQRTFETTVDCEIELICAKRVSAATVENGPGGKTKSILARMLRTQAKAAFFLSLCDLTGAKLQPSSGRPFRKPRNYIPSTNCSNDATCMLPRLTHKKPTHSILSPEKKKSYK